MKVSLVISTYNWPKALELCLYTVMQQTCLPDEIVIADDGSRNDTRELLDRFSTIASVPLRHVWQEDKGFRKTIIMNKAIKAAQGDYIIQIDGDILLHPQFVADHISIAEPGYFIRGGRSLISPLRTRFYLKNFEYRPHSVKSVIKMSNKLNSLRIPYLARIFDKESKDILHVKGCNMAYWKQDFIRINGYNNDISGWGHEDIELAIRLYNSGVKMKKAKFKAIAYHLYHKYNSRNQEKENWQRSLDALNAKVTRIPNGYDQL